MTLGLNVLELQFVMLANYDENVNLVLDLLKVCVYCTVGIKCTARFTV